MSFFNKVASCTGFQWDEGNVLKNWKKHLVSALECEQVFFNRPISGSPDASHSDREDRFYILGQTDTGRKLFIVFTVREQKIRVISARPMSKKEQKKYDSQE
ncbi:MAG: BrnT family toxin [Candidatus Delongbacteria bacterium]|nr:BrnT family toxin [bacterium]MBL7034094.1 BrnT family toxin [Candidatus Delongbacteria bacterium]